MVVWFKPKSSYLLVNQTAKLSIIPNLFKISIFKGILGGSDKEDMMSEYNLSIIIYMVEYHNEYHLFVC